MIATYLINLSRRIDRLAECCARIDSLDRRGEWPFAANRYR